MPISRLNKKTKIPIKTKSYTKKTSIDKSQFNIAHKIFSTIEIESKIHNNYEYYYIVNKLYDDYLNFKKYDITGFLLYCMLRFEEWKHKKNIDEFINFPARFPMKGYIATTDTCNNLNSFNKLLYLNNFIYHVLEYNNSIEQVINESKLNKWGYNISKIDIAGNNFYSIYYVIVHKGNVELYHTLINIIYPANLVDKYFNKVKHFVRQNIKYMNQQKYLTSVYLFYNCQKLNYKDKFIFINGLYIPKCNIEYNLSLSHNTYNNLISNNICTNLINIDDKVIDSILYKETNYPRPDVLNKMTYIFHKYRNIKQLEKDLIDANITKKDFNDMMRSIKPLCFSNKLLYRKFIKELVSIICSKLNNFTIKIFGTTTTFYSANVKPEKKDKFYNTKTSDIDVCIIPNENIDKYIPFLETDNIEITKTTGIYTNHKVRELFGDKLLIPFFNKWGPQTLKFHEYDDSIYNSTILKRGIGLVIAKKINLFDYPNIINENKTCFSNFATFIKNGKTLSYWNENNKLITESIS